MKRIYPCRGYLSLKNTINRGTTVLKYFGEWLDIRTGERQKVFLCIAGAFLLMAFVVLARSMREGLFLSVFNAQRLPYIMAAVACVSLPAVGVFANLLGRFHPWNVLKRLLLIFCMGLGLFWIGSPYISAVAVGFYIWTALGTMLLTSGFWILIADKFAVRGARRLFGMIAAGGTAGAMVTGLSLSRITAKLSLIHLMPLLIGILILFYLVQYWIHRVPHTETGPESGSDKSDPEEGGSHTEDRPGCTLYEIFNIPGNLRIIMNSPHLIAIASIVFTATVASSIVDYQFKEFAQARIGNGEMLAGFFGAFYGYAGLIALVLQLLFSARIMASAGVAAGIAVLPGLLLLGSTGLLILPGLIMATVVRGVDNTLRKSLLRPMLEFLYVPVPALIRRKTKTFIDAFVDSTAEGLGAVCIYLWVVQAGGQSKYLSVLVIFLSLVLFLLSRHAGRQYLGMIVRRLKEGDLKAERAGQADIVGMDPLTASFSRIDFHSSFLEKRDTESEYLLSKAESTKVESVGKSENETDPGSRELSDITSILQSSDNSRIIQVLDSVEEWDADRIPLLTSLLARDDLRTPVIRSLLLADRTAVPHLVKLLLDEDGDFVIRRRIPRALAGIGGQEAEYALLHALSAGRFEIRYRAVIALVNLRKRGFYTPADNLESVVWEAIRSEVRCSRPVWEFRRLLDSLDADEDDELVAKRVDNRFSHSLEHTFRMLTLVLDPEPVTAALHGILIGNEEFKGFALEYLERTLPADIRERLWTFFGDASEAEKEKELRPMQQVVSDLISSRATLFHDETDRDALKKMLKGPVE